MRKTSAIVLSVLAALFALGASASAVTHGEITVTVPYEFVAGGKILPPGQYSVSRISDDPTGGLSIRSDATGLSVFVMASQFQSRRIENCAVSFEEIEGQHLLKSISASDGVYILSLGRSANVLANAKQHNAMSASGN